MPITAPPSSRGYDPPIMPLVNRFTHSNGRSVSVHQTPTGVMAYVADEIPLSALIAWEAKLSAELGVPIETQGADDFVPDATPGARNGATG